jgi:hypothetical protein
MAKVSEGKMRDARRFIVRAFGIGCVVLAMLWLVDCGGGSSDDNGVLQNVSVSISPKRALGITAGQTQQFTAVVSGDAQARGVSWSVDGAGGGNATVGTIGSSGLYTAPMGGGTHTVTAISIANIAQSDSVTIAVTDLAGVFTYHNNLARDGTNTREYALTPSNVNITTFGKLFSCPVDGNVYAQQLWVPNVSVNGTRHNVVFVVTQHDSAYAFDADTRPCVVLWHADLLDSAHGASLGETTVVTAGAWRGGQDITPEVGVTGTPVIDPPSNTIYVVSKSTGPAGTFHQRLHALDLASGNEKFGGPVNISATVVGAGYDSSSGTVTFNPYTQIQRAGLALVNGVVHVAWAGHEDFDPFHGWIIGYDASSLAQVSVYNTTAEGGRAGVWSAIAADSTHTLYLSTGNGALNPGSNARPSTNLSESVLRIRTATGLGLSDWFTPFNQSALDVLDKDVGSGGVVLLPDQSSGPPHLLVAGGKEGKLYVVNRDSMGHFCGSCTATTGDTNVLQSFAATNGVFGTAAFWQNGLYLGGVSDSLKLFLLNPSTGKLNTSAASQSTTIFAIPGSTPSISSEGVSNGIVWAVDSSQFGVPWNAGGPAVLHAYDATNLAIELWNSSQAANNRDQAGQAVKFIVPTVANGKVYIGTRSTIEVYGLLPD